MDNTTVYSPIIEIGHPEMLITAPEHDSRFDVQTGCEYTENTETFD